jgi:hypothetical protein
MYTSMCSQKPVTELAHGPVESYFHIHTLFLHDLLPRMKRKAGTLIFFPQYFKLVLFKTTLIRFDFVDNQKQIQFSSSLIKNHATNT